MVLPLALAPFATKLGLVGAGAAGGYLASMLLGGKKEAAAAATAGEYHAPYEKYQPVSIHAPTTTQTFSPSYIYQIESPYGQITKKDVVTTTATPTVTTTPEYYQPETKKFAAEAEAGIGTDLVPIAVIGAVAIIGYGYISKEKS